MKTILSIGAVGVIALVLSLGVGCSGGDVGHVHGDHDHADHEHSEQTRPAETDSVMAMETKPNPLDKCVVSGEALGSMGDPVVLTHNGQEVKLCCNDCVDGFNKEPEKYLAALKEGQVPSKASGEHSSGHQH